MENLEVSRCIRLRRSVRSFSATKVEDEKILKILEAAYWAPSAHGLHWINIILVRDEEKILRVLSKYKDADRYVNSDVVNAILADDECSHYIRNVKAMIVVSTNVAKYRQAYRDPIKGACSNWRHMKMGDLFAVNDADLAAMNMTLQAHALGLGVCWIGHINGEKIRELLDIDSGKDMMPVCILLMGYQDKSGERKIDRIVNEVEQKQKGEKPEKADPDDIFKEETYENPISGMDRLKEAIEKVKVERERRKA